MSELIAKPVVKNKFWVVEESGNKIATIQARDDGGCVYVHNESREQFGNVQSLTKKYNIKLSKRASRKAKPDNTVYGYPASGIAYNQVYDVRRHLPIYTKTLKSKSMFCAGYYAVFVNGVWSEQFCPKNITLNRYNYVGPFKTKEDMHRKLKEIRG